MSVLSHFGSISEIGEENFQKLSLRWIAEMKEMKM